MSEYAIYNKVQIKVRSKIPKMKYIHDRRMENAVMVRKVEKLYRVKTDERKCKQSKN